MNADGEDVRPIENRLNGSMIVGLQIAERDPHPIAKYLGAFVIEYLDGTPAEDLDSELVADGIHLANGAPYHRALTRRDGGQGIGSLGRTVGALDNSQAAQYNKYKAATHGPILIDSYLVLS
jgi:hypothetical protein